MEPSPRRRLYRSRAERMISGVSGGIADYFDVDPVLVRLAWVVLTFLSGGLVALAYLLLWIVVPVEGSSAAPRQVVRENLEEVSGEARALAGQVREAFAAEGQPTESVPPGEHREPPARRNDRHLWAGGILIALGVIFLLDQLNLVWWFNWRTFWPVLLIAIGALLLWQRARA